MLRSMFSQARARKEGQKRAEVFRALMRYQAHLGGELFGPLPKGGRREFFCLDKHTWVWHEEWLDERGHRQVMTTRYDVRPNGVVKSQGNNVYQSLSLEEAENLYRAVQLYEQRVGGELRRMIGAA